MLNAACTFHYSRDALMHLRVTLSYNSFYSLYVHIGGGGEDCTRQVLCAEYVNQTSCSENFTNFIAKQTIGVGARYILTFNSSSAVKLNGSALCEVFVESSCSIEHIGLRERCDECMVSSKTSNTIEFSCGQNGIRGTVGTVQVLCTPMHLLPVGCVNNSNVFNIFQFIGGSLIL